MINAKGFTFVELLVVMSIVITLISLTIPAVINYQKTQAENEEIKNFISSFRTAQNLALTTDSTYTITFQNGEVSICPSNSTDCKKITNTYLRTTQDKLNINRYGNLVDQNNNIISEPTVTIESNLTTTKKILINKIGRISFVNTR